MIINNKGSLISFFTQGQKWIDLSFSSDQSWGRNYWGCRDHQSMLA